MDTSYYKEFSVLAEVQKYSSAAEQLMISEPSLSRHIKAIESELGVNLFDRTSRSVNLNEFGRIFLAYVDQFITLQQECQQKLSEAQSIKKSTVTINSAYFINDLQAKFYLYDPTISVINQNHGMPESVMLDSLIHDRCDFAFLVNPDISDEAFVKLPYATDRYIAALPADHRLAKRKSIRLSELENENFVSFMNNTRGDENIVNLCRKAGFTPRISFRADVGTTVASFVSEGMGVSILLEKSISKRYSYGIALVHIEPEEQMNIFICYKRNTKLTPAAAKFVEYATVIWPQLSGKAEFDG